MNTATAEAPAAAPAEETLTREELFRKERRKYIGGSDVAALLGLSPYSTPLELAREKRGQDYTFEGERKKSLEQVEFRHRILMRGKNWEPVVRDMLTDALIERGHDVKILGVNQRYTDPKLSYLSCEIDYEILLDGVPTSTELKTVSPFMARHWGEELSDEIPNHYNLQSQHGMMIRGRPACVFGALFGADEFKPFIVQRDDAIIKVARAKSIEFWERFVIGDEEPDAQNWTDLLVKYLIQPEAPSIEVTDEIYQALLDLRAAKSLILANTELETALKFKVGQFSKGTNLTRNGQIISNWKNRAYTVLDQSGIKKAYPKLHREFQRSGSTPTFTIVKKGYDK